MIISQTVVFPEAAPPATPSKIKIFEPYTERSKRPMNLNMLGKLKVTEFPKNVRK